MNRKQSNFIRVGRILNRTEKKCLKCSQPFYSSGVANRLCPKCKTTNAAKDTGTMRDVFINGSGELRRI